MPARNAGRFIGAAIESVLAQDGVRLELVVVDDASADDTAEVVHRFTDPRLRYERTDRRRGIGWCHNRALSLTTAPVIAHVDADDLILPRALAAMRRAAEEADVGQAYCDFYTIDAGGQATSESIARWAAYFHRHRSGRMDYARALLVHGMVVNHLRTYPRRVFERVGGFDEHLPYAVDYDMALRLAQYFRFVRVPEQLYAKRAHPGGVTEGLRLKGLRFWLMRARIARRLSRAQAGRVAGLSPGRRLSYLAAGLLHEVGTGPVLRLWQRTPAERDTPGTSRSRRSARIAAGRRRPRRPGPRAGAETCRDRRRSRA
jgi:glycosyltransferase involved in cell wall biosynthesis